MDHDPIPLFGDNEAAHQELHEDIGAFLEQEAEPEVPLSEDERIEATAFRALLASNLPDFYEHVKHRNDAYFLTLLRRGS